MQQVYVVNHQHYRRGHRPERRPEPRHHRAGHRAHGRGQCFEHPPADRLDRIQRPGHVTEQDPRVIVLLVDRHPGELLAAALGPVRQQGRLSVTRRRDHRDDRAGIVLRQLLDQRRPADRPRPHLGRAELGGDEVETRPSRALSRDEPLTYAAVLHAKPRPSRRCAVLCSCVTFITSRENGVGKVAVDKSRAGSWCVRRRLPWDRKASQVRSSRATRWVISPAGTGHRRCCGRAARAGRGPRGACRGADRRRSPHRRGGTPRRTGLPWAPDGRLRCGPACRCGRDRSRRR